MPTFEEVLIESMPFSIELITWCRKHPDFAKALKIIYPEKFVMLGAVVTSYSSYKPQDEVIGIYAYAHTMKTPKFKQDFVINKGKQNKEYVLYTRFYQTGSKYIKDINEFYKTYGKGGNYNNSHHLTYDELPDEIKPRAVQAINLANKISSGRFIKPSQDRIDELYLQIVAEKIKTGGYNKLKLK